MVWVKPLGGSTLQSCEELWYNTYILERGSPSELAQRFTQRRGSPRHIYYMKGIEIFIDESGDFGPYDSRCPFYIVTMVFHESDSPLFAQISELEYRLSLLGLEEHCIHTNPAIRGEGEYYGVDVVLRRKVLSCFSAFVRKSPLRFKTFVVSKHKGDTEEDVLDALRNAMEDFISANYESLCSYRDLMVAYDKGQLQLSRLISDLFRHRFPNVRLTKTLPVYSRIFQVADFVCTITKIALRLEHEGTLAKSEEKFFQGIARFKKTWLNPVLAQEVKF